MTQATTVVLGAGLAGLSFAGHAKSPVLLLEAQARPGGECITDVIQGYHFDRAGHLLHLRKPEMRNWLQALLPKQLASHQREAMIRVQGVECRYPFQANLYALPSELKAQAVLDYLKAVSAKPVKPKHFSEWAQRTFGSTIARLFMEPYNKKLWTVDPKGMTLAWMGDYMPRPEMARVISGAFQDISKGGGYNQDFCYPKQGGIELLAKTLARRCAGLHLQSRVVRLDQRQRTVEILGKGCLPWQQLVSTIPLPQLVKCLVEPPAVVLAASRKLRATSVMVVNLGIAREQLHTAHWLYFPESQFCFYRLGFPSNYGRVSPKGTSTLCAELAFPQGAGQTEQRARLRQVKQELIAAKLLTPQDKITATHVQYLPYAYVIFNPEYAQARRCILQYLERHGIYCIGRWGQWEYSAMEDALWQGKQLAEQITRPFRQKK